jgi:hypothetical protein
MRDKNLLQHFSRCFTTALCLCVLMIATYSTTFAQKFKPLGMSAIYARLDTFNTKLPAEKLYLQLDKPHYIIGDTIWFKAYLLNGTTYAFAPLSHILHVELINDSGKLVSRIAIKLKLGLGIGQLALNDPLLAEGGYTLRAYTNWMQNFGETYFFTQRLYIARPGNHLLVTEKHAIASKADDRDINVALQFSSATHQQLALHDLDIRLTDGKKVWAKNKVTTGVDGSLSAAFVLPAKYNRKSISVLVADPKDAQLNAVIPLAINDPEHTDLQFMPEGGHMVAGIPTNIGFKAIGDDGLATDAQGIVNDSKNNRVAVFKSVHKGMGSFKLNPAKGETYSAVLNLPNGKQKVYALPKVEEDGMVLHVDNDPLSDSLSLYLQVSPNRVNNQTCHLMALSRGVTCYGAKLILKKEMIGARIAKRLFPTGIAHFVILDNSGQPVNERLVFINHHDNLVVNLKTGNNIYHPHDSIAVSIKVTDVNGQPVTGSFSLAATDNGQVKPDSSNNIITNMLLTSSLKGNVEDAVWYFGDERLKTEAMDNLMLTQGWVGYNWDNMLKDNITVAYKPEPESGIGGRVIKLINSPLKNAKVVLFSPAINFVHDTVSNQNGQFMFTNLPATDSVDYIIQANKKSGGNFGLQVSVDEFKPAAINKIIVPQIKPWYVNSDTSALKLSDNNTVYQQAKNKLNYGIGGNLLKEVVIKSTKIVKGSQNLNGPGNADLVFNEDDLLKTPKKSLLSLLQESVKGFRLGTHVFVAHAKLVYSNVIFRWYLINDKFVVFIVDGIPLYKSIQIRNVDDLTDYLKAHNAEDVKGVEISYSKLFTSNYEAKYDVQLAFVEITTRTGNGNIFANTPGVYHYRPIPLTAAKQFYSPRYTSAVKSTLPDFRSTIHWEPNIVTDENGEAKFSFYAADQPSSYSLILQGTDLKGNLAFKTVTVTVK